MFDDRAQSSAGNRARPSVMVIYDTGGRHEFLVTPSQVTSLTVGNVDFSGQGGDVVSHFRHQLGISVKQDLMHL